MTQQQEKLATIYPACRSFLDIDAWTNLMAECGENLEPEAFPNVTRRQKDNLGLPDFLTDLARLEWALYFAATSDMEIPSGVENLTVNPSLQILELAWKNLPSFTRVSHKDIELAPEQGNERVLVWRDPKTAKAICRAAANEELLALKLLVEEIAPETAASEANLPVGAIDAILRRARQKGVLLPLRSKISREPGSFSVKGIDSRFLAAPVFTLQWHITQACDLHCKHCYDRSKRSSLELDQGIAILDDLRIFCQNKNVSGQVSFTGGNPLLHPHFLELYKAATDRDLAVAILGNPAHREQIDELVAVEPPVFYQVSLEGLREHNDHIRGSGHFDRVIDFLGVLRDLNIYSMVMLTLTKDNMGQVLPLAELLRDKTDLFTFNRLAMVGEGAGLQSASPDAYADFLGAYQEAAKINPVMGLKDNLFNIMRTQRGEKLFGGCAGYGCGAAFNFISVLPDGEAHACRKFPSYIGNVFEQNLGEIYESEMAQRYRAGSTACRNCAIRAVCGGCLAVAHGFGIDIFEERDPYCFIKEN